MSTRVSCFRGQGVSVLGKGYGAIRSYVSPTEVLVRFRNGLEVTPISELLPVAKVETIGRRFEEHDLAIELRDPVATRDNEVEPEVFDSLEEEEEVYEK